MFVEKRKPMTWSMKIGILCLALLAALVGLASCKNPLVQAVDDLRADAVSPRIVLSLADNSSLDSGGTAHFGLISSSASAELHISLGNDGKSPLSINVAGIALVPANGTEKGCFAISAKPDATIATGASSKLVIVFTPSTPGAKSALISIPTNDTRSPVFSFTVSGTGSPVLLSTAAVSSVTMTSANCGGYVTDDGGNEITSRGICWDTSPSPTIAAKSNSDGTKGTGIYTVLMSGLSAGTLYYVRAWTVNTVGTTYGPQISFWTLPPQPSAPSSGPVGGPDGSGKLAVSWTPTKGASAYDVYYSSSNNFYSSQPPVSVSVPSATLTGLSDFATYYLWIVARNASGSSAVSPSGTGIPGIRVEGIGLDRTNASLAIGSTLQLNATITPADATYPAVSWTSASASIASVSNGLVTAVAPGSTVITATSTATAAGDVSKSTSCTINVPPAPPVANTAATAYGGEVSLSWAASTGATSYNIYYSKTAGTGTGGTKVPGLTGTSATVSGLANWSNYSFVVTAVGEGGESLASNELSCMPIRQEVIVVNGGGSIDFNFLNVTAGATTRPSGHEYIQSPNLSALDCPTAVAIDPLTRNAIYVAYKGINRFATYSYDALGGYATASNTPHDDGAGPEHLIVVTTSSGKKCLYVAYSAQAFIVMYDIDASGSLQGPKHVFSNPRNDSARYLSADPSGRFLFASNFDASRITSYGIDPATGHLSEVGYCGSGGSNPYRSVVTPDGAYLLVTNYGSKNVVSFSISGGGVLSQQSSASTLGEGPTGIAVDATGKNAYVCSVKNRGSNANLGLGYLNHLTLSGGNLATAGDSSNTLYGPTDLALDATGTRLIVLNLASASMGNDGGGLVYQLNSDGSIVPKTGVFGASFATGGGPDHLVVVKLP